jgi:hypothetical protein
MIQQRQAFYEVTPYFIVLEDRSNGRAGSARRIHAGFDVDIHGVDSLREPVRPSEYGSGCAALQELAEKVMSQSSDSCSIQVIPFHSTLILDTRRNLQPQGMIRVRITHGRGLDQPSGPPEERALKAIVTELQDLGVSFGNRRA